LYILLQGQLVEWVMARHGRLHAGTWDSRAAARHRKGQAVAAEGLGCARLAREKQGQGSVRVKACVRGPGAPSPWQRANGGEARHQQRSGLSGVARLCGGTASAKWGSSQRHGLLVQWQESVRARVLGTPRPRHGHAGVQCPGAVTTGGGGKAATATGNGNGPRGSCTSCGTKAGQQVGVLGPCYGGFIDGAHHTDSKGKGDGTAAYWLVRIRTR
jgi:hypothetical protein